MSLFEPARFPFAGRAFEIKLVMHSKAWWQQVVHDDQADVFGVAAVAVEPEKLGQKRSRILLQVQVISGQQLLKKIGFLVLHRLADEVVVPGDVEDGAGHTGVGQLDHRLGAERREKEIGLDFEEVPEKPERVRGVGPEPEFGVSVSRSFLKKAVAGKGDGFAEQKILKKQIKKGIYYWPRFFSSKIAILYCHSNQLFFGEIVFILVLHFEHVCT